MIQHIVLFELTDELSGSKKTKHIGEIREAFEKLPTQIECLRSLRIYPNINSHEPYDFALVAELESMSDVENYANHEKHVTLVREMIKPYLRSRAAVDIEIS